MYPAGLILWSDFCFPLHPNPLIISDNGKPGTGRCTENMVIHIGLNCISKNVFVLSNVTV